MEPESKPSAGADPNQYPGENETENGQRRNAAQPPEALTEAPTPDLTPVAPPEVERGIFWAFMGPQGLRAGWSVLIFFAIMIASLIAEGNILRATHLVDPKAGFTPKIAFISELTLFVAMMVAGSVMALIERRKLLDYNLRDACRPRHFFSGLAVGFAALSVLVGSLAAGGWLHFGPVALQGGAIAKYAAIWGCVFLLVGCVEEGTVRCYLQYTLTRGINFWWALGVIAAICIDLVVRSRIHSKVPGHGFWGVYVIALLGLIPCYLLHRKGAAGSAFWQAAWVTSTFFGFLHTGNGGENWIGIFSAAAIGFVFCVSIWATGSAWWAIGAHAGWDWAETYFYGTADSGLVPKGHFLSTSPAGNPLFSGGADGPEGSLLILGILVLFVVWLVVVYRRRGAPPELESGAQVS